MEYPLPQFLEIKPKIVGPLTLRQLAYFLAAGGIFLYFYFTQAGSLIKLFFIAILLFGIAGILAFAKIRGYPIPTLIVRAFSFLFKTKIYIWQKGSVPTFSLPKTKKEKKKEEGISIKLAEKSRLRELSKLVELRR